MNKSYDHIIIDGHGTLYDDKYTPCAGALKFMRKYYKKTILFSNIGSKTGYELEQTLKVKFSILPYKIITSLDLMLNHIEKNKYRSIFHFGNNKLNHEINRYVPKIIENYEKRIKPDAVLFTSLPQDSVILRMQAALNYILSCNAKILLANPDRITLNPPYKITVAILCDSIINSLSKIKRNIEIVEFGKPYIGKDDLNIKSYSDVVVIGDNPWTDVALAKKMGCDSILITAKDVSKSVPYPVYKIKSLVELC